MLSDAELKSWLQKDLSRADKVLLVLASSEDPLATGTLKLKARLAGCNMDKWSIIGILTRMKGHALKLPLGFELSEKGWERVRSLGVGELSPAASQVAVDLRRHLANITSADTLSFIEEAIRCYEFGLHRSAIVMSWLASVDVLHDLVVAKHLQAFNAEASRVDHRWKTAITADDIGRMKESDFLDRLVAISVIGKNVKDELAKALSLRNGVGHPNSLKVSSNQAAAHIELLLLNVFDRFN